MELFWRNAQGLGAQHSLGPGDSIHIHERHASDGPVAARFEGVPFEPAAGAWAGAVGR